jgi:hypothetical protein
MLISYLCLELPNDLFPSSFERNIVCLPHLLRAVRNILFNVHAVQRPHFTLGTHAPGHDVGMRFPNDSLLLSTDNGPRYFMQHCHTAYE